MICLSTENDFNKKLEKIAPYVIQAGPLPLPVSDTLIEILKMYLDEEDVEFIKFFKTKKSLSLEQLVKKGSKKGWSEDDLKRVGDKLAKKGFI